MYYVKTLKVELKIGNLPMGTIVFVASDIFTNSVLFLYFIICNSISETSFQFVYLDIE